MYGVVYGVGAALERGGCFDVASRRPTAMGCCCTAVATAAAVLCCCFLRFVSRSLAGHLERDKTKRCDAMQRTAVAPVPPFALHVHLNGYVQSCLPCASVGRVLLLAILGESCDMSLS